jgi:hypothetical protein
MTRSTFVTDHNALFKRANFYFILQGGYCFLNCDWSYSVYLKVLISSSGEPTMGGPPVWGLEVGLTNYHRKKIVTKIQNEPWTLNDSLDKRPKRRNMDMRFRTEYKEFCIGQAL